MLYRTILCATDGLEHSDRAFARAGVIARESRAELHVAFIDERASGMLALGGNYMAEQRMLHHERVRRIRDQIAELVTGEDGLTIVPHLVTGGEGTVAAQLARLADQIDADLIVVGSRGRGPIGAVLAGSTARRLPHETKRPVLMLSGAPAGAGQAGQAGRDGRSALESVRHALHV